MIDIELFYTDKIQYDLMAQGRRLRNHLDFVVRASNWMCNTHWNFKPGERERWMRRRDGHLSEMLKVMRKIDHLNKIKDERDAARQRRSEGHSKNDKE